MKTIIATEKSRDPSEKCYSVMSQVNATSYQQILINFYKDLETISLTVSGSILICRLYFP